MSWTVRDLVVVLQRLSLARSVPEVQEVVRTAGRRLTGADGATFVLRDGDSCFYADEDAIAPLWKGQRFPMDTCISGWVMNNHSSVVIPDIYADGRIPQDAYRETFVKSMAMVPIRAPDPLGAIGNYWAYSHRPTAEDLEVLQALADSAALALENINAYEQLEEARLETLWRLALAAEYRDDATHEHADRVARASVLLARRLGLSAQQAELIGQAAPLHDVGKLAVPETLLLKPGRLTPSEFERIKDHAAAGASILAGSRSEALRLAGEIALTHHEWWDGSGYPAGLRGDDIPVAGRIVALVDVFDALTHERPYKDPWPFEQSMAEVRRLRGSQFDPVVEDAFEAVVAEIYDSAATVACARG